MGKAVITFDHAPRVCQTCETEFGLELYDVSLRGTWGCVCGNCFREYNCRLGTGLGQKFVWSLDRGTWVKVAG
jgi:hypothetical protein